MKSFHELSPATQRRLAAMRDPRVPEGYTPRPVGRPKGTPQSLEARRRISAARSGDPAFLAKKASRAIKDLLDIYGSVEAVIKELQRV